MKQLSKPSRSLTTSKPSSSGRVRKNGFPTRATTHPVVEALSTLATSTFYEQFCSEDGRCAPGSSLSTLATSTFYKQKHATKMADTRPARPSVTDVFYMIRVSFMYAPLPMQRVNTSATPSCTCRLSLVRASLSTTRCDIHTCTAGLKIETRKTALTTDTTQTVPPSLCNCARVPASRKASQGLIAPPFVQYPHLHSLCTQLDGCLKIPTQWNLPLHFRATEEAFPPNKTSYEKHLPLGLQSV